jgi:hypothetical protein
MSVGTGKQTSGFADVFGGKLFNTIDYSGPTAYNNTGNPATSGDSLDPKMFGFNNTIESIFQASLDQTGTYYAFEQPVNSAVTAWRLRWFTASGTEVANGVNLSNYTVKLSAVGF